jgi:glucosamine-6-phosphate deaminase
VPAQAITVGIATIRDARRLRLLAFGAPKREVVSRTLTSAPDAAWPASLLAGHPDVQLIVDRAAVG